MHIKPFSTTGIGSLPFTVPEEACKFVINCFDIPFWPQLPRLSFRESMVAQFTEGMPFLKIDDHHKTVYVKKDKGDDLERFYESWNEGTRIAISSDFAAGLHSFIKKVGHRRFDLIKGHITGPLTFTLSLKDIDGRFIYFDEELREIALMTLKAKALWQIDVLSQFAEGVLIFIDEPIFTALGSTSYMGVEANEVSRLMTELVSSIKSTGALCAVHCCGKADWEAIIRCQPDMLSFDCFDYFETFNIYAHQVKELLNNGGYIAWGIVPTSDKIVEVTYEGLLNRMRSAMTELSKTVDPGLIQSRSILTPACGAGSRTVHETIKIVQLLMRLKEDILSF